MQSPSHGGVGVLPGEQVVHSREDRLNRAGDERAGVEMVVGALDIYGVIFFVLLEYIQRFSDFPRYFPINYN